MKEYKDGKYDIKENFKGDKFWHLNGVLHREDGPACEYSSGDKYWYLNDKLYTESGYYKKIEEMVKGNEVTFEEFMEEIR